MTFDHFQHSFFLSDLTFMIDKAIRDTKKLLFLSLLLKISVGLTEPDFSKQRMMYILGCLTTYVSKQLRRSPSRVLGSKGSLNDPAPSVSLGQGGEPHERTIKISLKEEEKKG